MDTPFREDIDAELRSENAKMKIALDETRAESKALREELRLLTRDANLAWLVRGANLLIASTLFTAALVAAIVYVVSYEKAHPTAPDRHPSSVERQAAARHAATAYFTSLYPGASIRTGCRRDEPAHPRGEAEQTDEACTATVNEHAFEITCNDQIGSANSGCHDLKPIWLRQ